VELPEFAAGFLLGLPLLAGFAILKNKNYVIHFSKPDRVKKTHIETRVVLTLLEKVKWMEILLVIVLQNDGNRFLRSKAKRFANF
jgi:RsiW-degrading membrane proteinase PrsW (M82 family)